MMGLFSATVAANPAARPAQIPLVIDGTINGNGVPVGWELKTLHDGHRVKIEPFQNGRFGVRLVSEGNSFGLHKSVEVDLKEFPILSWKWKVDRLPPMGDIREKSKDDQAAQVYVIFPTSLLSVRNPMIGYIWDSNAPTGTITDGHAVMTPIKVVVLQSGKQRLGEWVQERRNVAEDYQRLFGEDSLPKVGRVAIWINTQHTKSSAEATFADLQFVRAK
ncbi:MAG: DUF3047 domain-containing protein [Candidatus Methylomirabilis sp.]